MSRKNIYYFKNVVMQIMNIQNECPFFNLENDFNCMLCKQQISKLELKYGVKGKQFFF